MIPFQGYSGHRYDEPEGVGGRGGGCLGFFLCVSGTISRIVVGR